MPTFPAIGRRIGVNIRIAGPVSVRRPTTGRTRSTTRSTTVGSGEVLGIRLVTAAGMPVDAVANESAADAASRGMIAPVIFTVSVRKLGKLRNGVVRQHPVD